MTLNFWCLEFFLPNWKEDLKWKKKFLDFFSRESARRVKNSYHKGHSFSVECLSFIYGLIWFGFERSCWRMKLQQRKRKWNWLDLGKWRYLKGERDTKKQATRKDRQLILFQLDRNLFSLSNFAKKKEWQIWKKYLISFSIIASNI